MAWLNRQNQWLRWGLVFVATLAVPVVYRCMLCAGSTVLLSRADVQGFLLDTCVAALWVLAAGWIIDRARLAGYGLMVSWCLLHAMCREHVQVLGTLPSLAELEELAKPAFLLGSGVAIAQPWLLVGLMLASTAALALAGRAPNLERPQRWFVAGMLLFTLGLPLVHEYRNAALWRQTSAVAYGLDQLLPNRHFAADSTAIQSSAVREGIDSLSRADLNGRPLIARADKPRNVLLIVLESISGANLEPILRAQGMTGRSPMPHLSKLAEQNVVWTQFVAQQRQTDRGLYALVTGQYTGLTVGPSLMSSYEAQADDPPLPRVLRDAGYQTLFLQAGDLDYMRKGRFMRLAGFEHVQGEESFHGYRFRTGWGPDDRSLMELGYQRIGQLKTTAKPWFVTLFTVGTHHPFQVPADFHSDYAPGSFENSAAYADLAVAELLDKLRRDGTLDNTLVLITSDESRGHTQGPTDLDCELSQNWGFLIAITPQGERRQIDQPFLQSDLALSVVDYLGLTDRPQRFTGRSAFRAYDRPRPIFCANVYFGTTSLFDVDGCLYVCPHDLRTGHKYRLNSPWLFASGKTPQCWEPTKLAFLTAMVRYSLGKRDHSQLAQGPPSNRAQALSHHYR